MGLAPATLSVVGLAAERGQRTVLEDVIFEAAPGEVVAVLGPNGAGKTTLLEAVVGVLHGSRGQVSVGGRRLVSFRERAQAFAYMPDDARLPEEVTIDTLLGPSGSDVEEALDVTRFRSARAGELSRGEAKRVWLVLTLMQDRPIFVLDEPFGAFDPLQLDGILDVVRARAARPATVVVTIHQMSTAERIADRVVLLAGGRVAAAGSLVALAAEHRARSASAEDVFRAVLGGTTHVEA